MQAPFFELSELTEEDFRRGYVGPPAPEVSATATAAPPPKKRSRIGVVALYTFVAALGVVALHGMQRDQHLMMALEVTQPRVAVEPPAPPPAMPIASAEPAPIAKAAIALPPPRAFAPLPTYQPPSYAAPKVAVPTGVPSVTPKVEAPKPEAPKVVAEAPKPEANAEDKPNPADKPTMGVDEAGF